MAHTMHTVMALSPIMSHVPRMIESRPTYEWVTSHICMSHVSQWSSHVPRMIESRHAYSQQHPRQHLWIWNWISGWGWGAASSRRLRAEALILTFRLAVYLWKRSYVLVERILRKESKVFAKRAICICGKSFRIYFQDLTYSPHLARITSHIIHMKISCPTYEWVVSITWMNRVSRGSGRGGFGPCHNTKRALFLYTKSPILVEGFWKAGGLTYS